jgi:hypothetical protein
MQASVIPQQQRANNSLRENTDPCTAEGEMIGKEGSRSGV